DGHEFPVELAISPALRSGAAITFVAFLRDISDRKRAEAVQAGKYAVTAALVSAASWAEAAPAVMASICGAHGWELAEYWGVDGDGDLRREHAWHGTDSAALEHIRSSRGQGLAGEAWSSGHTVWGCDTANDGGGRDGENGHAPGVGEVVAFPVTSGGRTAGVMALYGREQRRPDEEMEAALADVGSRIAHFLDRK